MAVAGFVGCCIGFHRKEKKQSQVEAWLKRNQNEKRSEGRFFVVLGIASGGGRRGLLIENSVGFQHGLSHAAGLSVIGRFYFAGRSPDDE